MTTSFRIAVAISVALLWVGCARTQGPGAEARPAPSSTPLPASGSEPGRVLPEPGKAGFWPTRVCTLGPHVLVLEKECACEEAVTCFADVRGDVLELRVPGARAVCKDCWPVVSTRCALAPSAAASGAKTLRVTLNGEPLLDSLRVRVDGTPDVGVCTSTRPAGYETAHREVSAELAGLDADLRSMLTTRNCAHDERSVRASIDRAFDVGFASQQSEAFAIAFGKQTALEIKRVVADDPRMASARRDLTSARTEMKQAGEEAARNAVGPPATDPCAVLTRRFVLDATRLGIRFGEHATLTLADQASCVRGFLMPFEGENQTDPMIENAKARCAEKRKDRLASHAPR